MVTRRNSVQIELDLKSKQAQRDLRDLAASTSDLDGDLDDAATAGQAFARAIEAAADQAIDEIDATKRAVDAMEDAFAGVDTDIEFDSREVVSDLKRIGLTADQIEGEAESLAKALRRSEDVKLKATAAGFDDIGQAVGGVRDAQDKARGATNSFVGNAVSELPGVSEAFGPAGEAVSQLTEGLLEGEVGFGELAKAGLGMAAVGGAVVLVTSALSSMAETKAFEREQVESYVDAIRDVGDGVEAVNKALLDSEEITGRVGGFAGFFEDTEDIVPTLAELGLTWDEVASAIANGGDELESILDPIREQKRALNAANDEAISYGRTTTSNGDAIVDSLDKARRYGQVIEVLGQQSGAYVDAAELAQARTKVFGEVTEDATPKIVESSNALEQLNEQYEREVEALEEANELLEEQNDARLAAADAVFAQRDAEDDLLDKLEAVTDELEANSDNARDRQRVLDDVAKSAGRLADAEVRIAEETARASGTVLTATERTDAFNLSLLNSAQTAKGEARDAILSYLEAVADIPPEVVTSIRAALERGDIDEAERLLNVTSRNRKASIQVDANTAEAERQLNFTARDRVAQITGDYRETGVPQRRRARGGFTRSNTPYLVGEEGPELYVPRTAGTVVDAQDTAALLGRQPVASASALIQVTQNFPAGVSPETVARSLDRYQKRNGK